MLPVLREGETCALDCGRRDFGMECDGELGIRKALESGLAAPVLGDGILAIGAGGRTTADCVGLDGGSVVLRARAAPGLTSAVTGKGMLGLVSVSDSAAD